MKEGEKYVHKFIVTDETYQGFIGAFNDRNPLHTDEAFAMSKGFKGKVMHGNILNGFISYFVGECLPVKNVAIQLQSITYVLPVYLHDELEFTAEIKEYFDSVYAYCFSYYFKNKDGKKVAKGDFQIGLLV